MRQVPYVNFPAQFADERSELLAITERVFAKGEFVGGGGIESLEAELAALTRNTFAVALASGTDALILGLKALGIGPGDEVITPPNSFIASTAAIVAVGAKPVFADVRADQNIDPAAVEAAITPATRAIMPVHLTGRVADMAPLMATARKHALAVIEDAAQSIASTYDGNPAGSFGDIGCFSAHPLKNLNAAGDAGFLVTNDEQVASRVRRLRNHGLIDRNTAVEWGTVSRLDTLQAEYVRFRLSRLPSVIEKRRANAGRYRSKLAGLPIFNAPCRNIEFNTFHLFVIEAERRDELQRHLAARGIATGVHYPVPIHLQPAAAALGYERGSMPMCERQADRILSLPIHQYLTDEDIDWTVSAIREFVQ
jgi:dTDP-4-amino-4,6-dideoxygalactose transaminase